MQITLLTVTAIISGVAVDIIWRLSQLPPDQGPWIDWLAWILLVVWYRIKAVRSTTQRASSKDAKSDSLAGQGPEKTSPFEVLTLIIGAVALVSTSFLWNNKTNLIIWAVPLATIPLLAANRTTFWKHRSGREPVTETGPRFALQASVSMVSISLVASFFLFSTRPDPGYYSGFLFTALQSITYFVLSRQGDANSKRGYDDVSSPAVMFDILALAVFGLWTLYVVAQAPWFLLAKSVFLLGITRSYNIYCMLALCGCGLAVPASLVQTTTVLVVASLQDVTTTFDRFAASLISMGLLVHLSMSLPTPSAMSRKWTPLVLMLLPIAGLMGVLSFSVPVSSDTGQINSSYTQIHPIEKLVDAGQALFEQLVAGQSKTIDEAVATYIRKNNRRPPPDFDKWFEIAQKNSYVLVDEFDSIMESIEPFWGIAPSILRARVDSLQGAGYLIRWDIKDHKIKNSTDHVDKWQAEHVNIWLSRPGYLEAIPDMAFVLSFLDEPRVSASFDAITSVREAARIGLSVNEQNMRQSTEDDAAEFLDLGRQNTWQAIMSSCSISSPARSAPLFTSLKLPLEFITSLSQSLDSCQIAYHHSHHGLLSSPESLLLTHTLVPILSQGKPSMFNDILYPSVWYWGQMMGHEYDPEDDNDYALKRDVLYWTGKATGGHTRLQNWQKMHRPRMALLTAADSTAPTTLLRRDQKSQIWQEYESSYANLSHLFDIRITDVGPQCEPAACAAVSSTLHLIEYDEDAPNPNADPVSASYGSKFVLDMDGNAFSGRYYRLLKSKSCVLKQTIIKEWHDGRLVPWVHFIPISLEAKELGEVMRWLLEEEKGREAGERIAREGMEWARRTLRTEDLEITMLRLLMELARVMSDERDTLNYEL